MIDKFYDIYFWLPWRWCGLWWLINPAIDVHFEPQVFQASFFFFLLHRYHGSVICNIGQVHSLTCPFCYIDLKRNQVGRPHNRSCCLCCNLYTNQGSLWKVYAPAHSIQVTVSLAFFFFGRDIYSSCLRSNHTENTDSIWAVSFGQCLDASGHRVL